MPGKTPPPVPPSPGAVSPGGVTPRDPYSSYVAGLTPSVSVSLAVKRWRLVLIAFLAIGAVAAAMLVFRDGVNLKTVQQSGVSTATTIKQQEKLLDKYNSYTGNVASALTKPIEVFATMALQLVLLRFAANAVLQPRLAWRVDKLSALAAWALLYLLLNGFNSLNVQMRAQHVVPIMQASDLALVDSSAVNATAEILAKNTNASHVVRESTPGNLVTNTVLRTAITSRQWGLEVESLCKFTVDDNDLYDGVEFGFPIRSWFGKMLPAAPPTKAIMFPLTGTANTTFDADQLPMNASRAAMVFLAGVQQSYNLLAWFGNNRLNRTAPKKASMVANQTYLVDDARSGGLLPPTDNGSEASEREWLLKAAPRLLKVKFGEPKDIIGADQVINNDTERALSLSFSHVDLAPGLEFDAVTFEAVVNLANYTTAVDADGSTRYLSWDYASLACGPQPSSLCMVRKAKYGVLSDGEYDVPSQIQTGAICVNSNGSESQTALYELLNATGRAYVGKGVRDCNATSNTSMLVMSVAKRIVVDAVLLNETAQTKGITPALEYPVLVNPRKIYSITVGRLGWQSQDLAAAFGAECRAGKCDGLQFPLTDPTTMKSAEEVLIAGVDRLPVKRLGRIDFLGNSRKKYTPLVTVHEPLRAAAGKNIMEDYDDAAGDILLAHNLLSNATFNVFEAAGKLDSTCPMKVENRLHQVLDNHIYMEDGLQPAYMSALFWLFQNGVVRSVVNSTAASASGTAKTLQFDGNIQVSALVASIPDTNVWLSLAGCILLAVGVIATVVNAGQLIKDPSASVTEKQELHHVANVSDPRVIAQVMLDEARFPPAFLHRRIVDTSGNVGITKMASFEIASMTLQGEAHDGTKKVVLANQTSSEEP